MQGEGKRVGGGGGGRGGDGREGTHGNKLAQQMVCVMALTTLAEHV